MSNYTKSTNFAVKDGLSAGTPAKRVRGTEIDDEYNAIAVAVATKANTNNAALTGVPTAPTAATTTNTTQLATTALVQANVSTKADTNNAALTGVPTAPTASTGTNTTQLATTAFVQANVAVMPAGSVVQVKTFRTEGAENTNSTSFVGSSLTGQITPQSSSNKILVICNVTCTSGANISGGPVYITAYRGSGLGTNLSGTNLAAFANSQLAPAFGVWDPLGSTNTSGDKWGQLNINHLDSPSSTSAVNYTVGFRSMYSNHSAMVGGNTSFPAASTMTLMEIKG